MFKPEIEKILQKGSEIKQEDIERDVKVSISLRVPKSIVDRVTEIAAEQTLKRKQRVSASAIYLQAIKDFLDNYSNSK